MREYFAEMIKVEEILDQMSKVERVSEKEKLLEELLNLECLGHHTRYSSVKDIKDEFKNGEGPKENLQELKADFFISRGLSNLNQDGSIDERKLKYHTHDYIEIIYVYEGQYTHFINGTKYQHHKGEFCILNTNVLHRDDRIGKEDLVIFLCLRTEYLKRIVLKEEPCYKSLKDMIDRTKDKKVKEYMFFYHKGDLVKLLMERMAKEQHEKLMGYEKVIEGCIERLIFLMCQYYQAELITEQGEKVEKRIFMEIDKMIRRDIGNITRAELAENFYYTPDHINRIIKQNTGQTYVEYTKRLKLEYVKEALLESDKSINSIIKEVGYNNKTYFYKMFINEYGVTPKKYKENYKNNILVEKY